MLKTYLKIAWRNARKNSSYTVISLGSLVLGITLFFLISLWVKDEMSYDTHFDQAQAICRVETTTILSNGEYDRLASVGWPVGKTMAAQYPEVEHLTYFRNWYPIINVKGSHFYEDAFYADHNFFRVFGYTLQQGDTASALTDPYSVVISQKVKEKYFGKEDAVGKTLFINDTVPYKVTGVFNELPANSHMKFDMVGSFQSFCAQFPGACEEEWTKGWFDINVYNYVRLRKAVSPKAFEAKIKNLVLTAGKETVQNTGFKATLSLTPVQDIYLHSDMPTGKGTIGSIKTIKLFLAIGIFILLIACLNFINLSTARSIERAKETGIQKVLGNNRSRLIVQFLTETGLLCIIASIISVVLMIALLPVFNGFTGKSFTSASLLSTGNLLLLAGILLVLIPLAGFYPAWVLSSFKPITVLKGAFAHTAKGSLLRKVLVVTQFVISAGFIMSTIIIWKQMQFMQDRQLGFNKDKVLLIDMNKVPWRMLHKNADLFKSSLLSKTGVQKVTACGAVPGRSGWNGQYAYPEGKSKDDVTIVEYISADADYISTLGLQLATGRDFLPNSEKDENESFIINETAIKTFGWKDAKDALGKKLSTSGKDGIVVGVLKDYHQHGLQEKINPIVLSPIKSYSLFALQYNGIAPRQAVSIAEQAFKQVYAGYPIQYRFMDEDYQRQYAKEERQQSFFLLAAILSVVLACLGLLGLTIYTVQKRIKEIGVRKVLGASVPDIVRLLSKDMLALVGIAIVIATPVAWWAMNNWLQNFAYRTSVAWWVFAIAGLAALLVALFTISFQAIRAAMRNPVTSLRSE